MGFQDLNIEKSYISCGPDSISTAFLVPLLKQTRIYKRSVGFFSSSVFELIIDGIVALVRNKGTIQLIASPELNQDDVEAISLGYKNRDAIIEDIASRNFTESIQLLDDTKLQLLAALITEGVLDIKIAVTQSTGIYHDKLGILEDNNGDSVVFYGSANSSLNGYQNNYEKIRVVKSWRPYEAESVKDEIKEFDALWNGKNTFVKVLSFKESAQNNILHVISHRKTQNQNSDKQAPVKLRDYQQEAIQAWIGNGYRGFYVMATGTGKTWTAIYSAKALLDEVNSAMIVICAPYKHLVRQWADDLEKVFTKAKIILVSSENPGWETQISQEIIRKKYNPENQIIIVSTIASFSMNRFMSALAKSDDPKMLIVDEAHRFTNRPESLHENFPYMLGLSATPFSGTSAQRGYELMSFFGGQVFNLPIEDALMKGFLVPYYYRPIYVYASKEEEERFQHYTHKILTCFKNNVCIKPDLLVKTLRNRLRVISMAEEKQTNIDEIISKISEKDHFVVYCGDGRLFSSDGEEIRHIQSIKRVLTTHGFKSSQFTASENMSERMSLVEAFNNGEISALAAIRCLDEGINIPSIKSALILSSNDDYREFVQRRGRILRKYPGKENATIYDVIVLPSSNLDNWAKIELRRFYEYARLSINWPELESELESLLTTYSLEKEDIDVYDYEEEMENGVDE